MERTFKDNVRMLANRIYNRNRYLKPVAVAFVFVVLSFYNVYSFFRNNEKRFVTILLASIFFFINTSFSGIDNADAEVYLASAVDTEIEPEVNATAEVDNEVKVTVIDDDEIISTKLLSSDLEKSLENVDDASSFTLDDFLEQFTLNENNDLSDDSLSGFDKDAWYLILVNKTHPVPDDYEMELATISGTMKCDARVLDILLTMLNGAKKDGVNLIVCSPYRDYELQKQLFNRRVDQYVANGYSYLDAYRLASQKVIVPGASEHQLGLAFDIVTDYHKVLDYEFGDTEAGKWLKKHCAEYGFILRYPRGKESITGIEFEPWHFRYVGVEAATYIMENNITLEEFIEGL